jgi:glycosyltransferase involved in cell wall biosynthesis
MEASTSIRPVRYADARARTAMTGSPALLWVGRLDANKDPLTVLAGFEACAPALPDATLTMVFTATELLAAVTDRIARSPTLRERVRLVGAVPHHEMAFFFSGADLFVLGSHHEGSGYALIEAIACGATPVVTHIPTFRLLTGGGAIGASWTPGDAGSCAAALRASASRGAVEGRDRIIDHFDRHLTWSAIGQRALEIYTDVIASRA